MQRNMNPPMFPPDVGFNFNIQRHVNKTFINIMIQDGDYYPYTGEHYEYSPACSHSPHGQWQRYKSKHPENVSDKYPSPPESHYRVANAPFRGREAPQRGRFPSPPPPNTFSYAYPPQPQSHSQHPPQSLPQGNGNAPYKPIKKTSRKRDKEGPNIDRFGPSFAWPPKSSPRDENLIEEITETTPNMSEARDDGIKGDSEAPKKDDKGNNIVHNNPVEGRNAEDISKGHVSEGGTEKNDKDNKTALMPPVPPTRDNLLSRGVKREL